MKRTGEGKGKSTELSPSEGGPDLKGLFQEKQCTDAVLRYILVSSARRSFAITECCGRFLLAAVTVKKKKTTKTTQKGRD